MFTHEDLIKFYMLLNHYDIASPNIGVIDRDRFNELIQVIKKEYKNHPNVRTLLNVEHTKFSIIDDDIEITYILIQESEDLRGRFFRKYI